MPKEARSYLRSAIKNVLAHPLTRGLNVDDPRTSVLRRQIIQEKKFLRQIYQEWYRLLRFSMPSGKGFVLEIGSGAGFLSEFFPDLIASDVIYRRGIKIVLDGHHLPFADGTLKAIVMIDVLHHMSRARDFFLSAARSVRAGGVIAMIEPWVSSWSKLIFMNLHDEPFEPGAGEWEFQTSGPLSGANAALPWILFERDRARFEHEFPQWQIHTLEPMMPLCYLVSGGVSLRSLMPAFSFRAWRAIEKIVSRINNLSLFALIVLRRVR